MQKVYKQQKLIKLQQETWYTYLLKKIILVRALSK